MEIIIDDGGRKAAGFTGENAGDCVTRAIAIATGRPYREVYDALNAIAQKHERRGKRKRNVSSSRVGVYRQTFQRYLEAQGWTWHPTMKIGRGCRVHLSAYELPRGRLVVVVSKHVVAVIDGVVYDTSDPTRDETRCVYGYFQPPPEE